MLPPPPRTPHAATSSWAPAHSKHGGKHGGRYDNSLGPWARGSRPAMLTTMLTALLTKSSTLTKARLLGEGAQLALRSRPQRQCKPQPLRPQRPPARLLPLLPARLLIGHISRHLLVSRDLLDLAQSLAAPPPPSLAALVSPLIAALLSTDVAQPRPAPLRCSEALAPHCGGAGPHQHSTVEDLEPRLVASVV